MTKTQRQPVRLTKEQITMLIRIVITILILVGGALFFDGEKPVTAQVMMYLTAYILIGYDIILRAVTRLAGRRVFDENFLMLVASAGALALKDFEEGVAVLLLYQIGELFEDVAIERSRASIRKMMQDDPPGRQKAQEKRRYEGLGHDHASHGNAEGASTSEQFISRFARVYTPIICIGALATGLLVPLARLAAGMNAAWSEWIYRSLTFLVISCPCAMVISIPLSFSAGIGAAGREGVYFRDPIALEKLAKKDAGTAAEKQEGILLVDDDGTKMNTAKKIADKTMRIVRENIWFSIGIKVVCLILGVCGYAPIWLAIFADDGVMILAVLNAMRGLLKPAMKNADDRI